MHSPDWIAGLWWLVAVGALVAVYIGSVTALVWFMQGRGRDDA